MSDYKVTLTRGKYGHECILVRGNIFEWLKDHKAAPTKDRLRFVVSGWRCVVEPLLDSVVPTMERIFDRKYQL